MKINIFVLWLLSFCSFNEVSADQVSCERIQSFNWGSTWGNWKTCYMDKTTEINSANITIASRDDSVQGVWFSSNKKIFFLPVGLSDKFPNLLGLIASQCSLTTISKANFKGLSKLRGLYLYFNQIEKITHDVFDDLIALEWLILYGNKLKLINGKAFARLTKLTLVYLSSNQCIDENFNGASRIAELQQTVNAKCSLNEGKEDVIETTTETILGDKKCEPSQVLATFAITLGGIETKPSEVISKLNELKSQQKEECGNIVARALEAQTKVFEIQAKTFKEQTAEIINVKAQIISKMSEIENLREELQKKNEQIIENNGKIKKLQEKIETLSANYK